MHLRFGRYGRLVCFDVAFEENFALGELFWLVFSAIFLQLYGFIKDVSEVIQTALHSSAALELRSFLLFLWFFIPNIVDLTEKSSSILRGHPLLRLSIFRGVPAGGFCFSSRMGFADGGNEFFLIEFVVIKGMYDLLHLESALAFHFAQASCVFLNRLLRFFPSHKHSSILLLWQSWTTVGGEIDTSSFILVIGRYFFFKEGAQGGSIRLLIHTVISFHGEFGVFESLLVSGSALWTISRILIPAKLNLPKPNSAITAAIPAIPA